MRIVFTCPFCKKFDIRSAVKELITTESVMADKKISATYVNEKNPKPDLIECHGCKTKMTQRLSLLLIKV